MFDQGLPPNIVCVNKATTPLGITDSYGKEVTFAQLVQALNFFVNNHFAKIWGTRADIFPAPALRADAWGIVFLDNSDQADAEGYHDLTPNGLPLGKVFVKSTLEAGDKVSVTASHELAEMLVDPGIQMLAMSTDGTKIYSYEVCDAVEESEFLVQGIPMSNFVFPSWFEGFHKPHSTHFDYLGKLTQPFELMAGGYIPVFQDGKWSQEFGSPAKCEKFQKEDRRQHRSERRPTPLAPSEDQRQGVNKTAKKKATE